MSDSSKEVSTVSTKPSPYTLARSDNPGAVISLIFLNGDNNNEWAREMHNALQAKCKTCFINGTLKKPYVDDPDFENWEVVNSMIVGWIRASIKPTVKSTVTFISEAHKLWNELQTRLSVGNKVFVHQLRAQIAGCQQDGQAIVEYYGRLCQLWDEFQVYKPMPACSCSAVTEISKYREEEKLHQFIMGLDDSKFGSVCTTLVGSDMLSSLGEAYSRVIRGESRLATSRFQHQEVVGFVTRGDFRTQSSKATDLLGQSDQSFARPENSILRKRDRQVVCAHCGRPGHEKKTVGTLLGFQIGGTSVESQVVAVVAEALFCQV